MTNILLKGIETRRAKIERVIKYFAFFCINIKTHKYDFYCRSFRLETPGACNIYFWNLSSAFERVLLHFDFKNGIWSRGNATRCGRCNRNNQAGAINETSTVRQPQYASTSLRDCRTFLASWRQRARYRWLNQLLALSTFPARIFHFDIDLLVALVPRYFAPLRFTRTALDFRRSRTHFYSFPYIDHFGAPSFFCKFTSFFLFLPSYFYFLRPILWRNVGSRTGFYTLEKRRVVESRFSDKMIKK